MRNALLVSAAWLGVLQAALATSSRLQTVVSVATIVSVAIVLGMRAYRAGAWTKGVEESIRALGATVEELRTDATTWFGRTDQRLDAIDHVLTKSAEERTRTHRRQARVERRIERLEALHSTEQLQ